MTCLLLTLPSDRRLTHQPECCFWFGIFLRLVIYINEIIACVSKTTHIYFCIDPPAHVQYIVWFLRMYSRTYLRLTNMILCFSSPKWNLLDLPIARSLSCSLQISRCMWKTLCRIFFLLYLEFRCQDQHPNISSLYEYLRCRCKVQFSAGNISCLRSITMYSRSADLFLFNYL